MSITISPVHSLRSELFDPTLDLQSFFRLRVERSKRRDEQELRSFFNEAAFYRIYQDRVQIMSTHRHTNTHTHTPCASCIEMVPLQEYKRRNIYKFSCGSVAATNQ